MTMQTFYRLSRITAAALVAVLILSGSAFAQTATTHTTLSAAVSSSDTTIRVASATGFTAGTTWAYVDREIMIVRAVSGTNISVIRGANGTRATSHVANSRVYVGPVGAFLGYDPSGSCTAANEAYLPQISVASGNVWTCNSAGYWQAVNFASVQGSLPRKEVADAAYTALPSDYLIVYTSITADRVVTLPSPLGLAGKSLVIADESGLVTVNTTIGVVPGSTNQLNGGTTTQIDIATAYSFLKLKSNGASWIAWGW
jgi:hypothetical protein